MNCGTEAPPPQSVSDWKLELRTAVRDVRSLETLLPGIADGPWAGRYRRACELRGEMDGHFRFGVTRYYLGLAHPEDPRCPILQQILPAPEELNDSVFTLADPLAEEAHMPVAGLTHRYPDRVLWYLTHHCAVYCRFCMRKRKVAKPGTGPSGEDRDRALAYVRDHSEIREVILSGGDPLSLSDRVLDELLRSLRAIPHLSSVRLHTRMPVTLPSRITAGLCEVFSRHEPITVVTHFNHERELTPSAIQAIRGLRLAGCLVLNQSVLLSGINDTRADLEALFLALIRRGVKPYYLHQCDEVHGLSHFRVRLEDGMRLMRELRGTVPGTALPLYVVDLPGGAGKVPVDGSYLIRSGDRDGGSIYHNGHGQTVELARFADASRHAGALRPEEEEA